MLLRAIGLSAVLLTISAPAYAENQVVKCKTSVARRAPIDGPALTANVAGSMKPIALDAVQFTDKKLAKSVLVEGIYSRRTETNTVQLMTRLVNCTKKPLQVRMRTSFMDEQHFPTEAISAWRTVFLPPLGTGVYNENSIGRDPVANFLIELAPN